MQKRGACPDTTVPVVWNDSWERRVLALAMQETPTHPPLGSTNTSPANLQGQEFFEVDCGATCCVVCASPTSVIQNRGVHHGDAEARRGRGNRTGWTRLTRCCGFILCLLFILSTTSGDLPRRGEATGEAADKNVCSPFESRSQSDVTVSPSALFSVSP